MERVAHYWATVAPAVDEASKIVNTIPTPASAGAASLLGMVAKLHITSLPPVEGVAWSVERITGRVGNKVMDGVRWTLPQSIFEELGSRLTGSIAVFFHPAQAQRPDRKPVEAPTIERRAVLAHAVVHGPKRREWVPGEQEHIELFVEPRLQ